MKPGVWTSTAMSHAGSVRPLNEDAFLNKPNAGLWCVADGMGGHLKGEIASGLIVEKLSDLLCSAVNDSVSEQDEKPNHSEEPKRMLSVELIRKAIDDANIEINKVAKQLGDKVGSTASILYIEKDIAHVLWAGDSRIYHLTDSKLEQVTSDHNQAAEMVKYGFITAEQACRHPGANLLTRAVGTNLRIELEHKTVRCKPTDRFILCTDGLNGVMESEAIESYLNAIENEDISENLINRALDNWALDNITAVAVSLL